MGAPVARAIAGKGHHVFGYDISAEARRRASALGLVATQSLSEVVRFADLVFVAIQTPHAPEFEGVTRLPAARRDFDYSYLIRGIEALSRKVDTLGRQTAVAVVSTVLPGTMAREITPRLSPLARLVYNPSFIAQGTIERDFLFPEFVLLGVDDPWAADRLGAFYRTLTDAPQVRTAIANAELIKVAYNTYIGWKIAFANTLMEICHKTGCDVDDVTNALGLASRRLMSPMYLSGGMGDGGACHPRDNIALSWLARGLDLSYDLFDAVMQCREKQAEWLADLMCQHDLPKCILGRAYKEESTLTTGSAAVLVENLLTERGHQVLGDQLPSSPHVILIGNTRWINASLAVPKGSVVIDPWRRCPSAEGVEVIRLGQGTQVAELARA